MTEDIKLIDVYTKQIEMSSDIRNLAAQLPDHENRIRALEKWRYSIPVTAFTATGSLILALFSLFHGGTL